MNTTLLIDILGWMGAVVILVAYLLVSTKRVEGDSAGYQLLNLGGAVGLLVNTFFYGAYPSSWVNVVWIGIAVYALTRRRRSAANV